MTETTTTGALPELTPEQAKRVAYAHALIAPELDHDTMKRLATAWGVYEAEALSMWATAQDVIHASLSAEIRERQFVEYEEAAYSRWAKDQAVSSMRDAWIARARIHRDYEARVDADIEERTRNTSEEMNRVTEQRDQARAEVERLKGVVNDLDAKLQQVTTQRERATDLLVELSAPTAPDGTPLDATDIASTASVLGEVAAERVRQFAKWGRQRWPLTPMLHPAAGATGASLRFSRERRLLAGGLRSATEAKSLCEYAFKEGIGTFAHILVEEAAEAIDAPTLDEMRAELIQVAAVAVQMVEVIDLNAADAKAAEHG